MAHAVWLGMGEDVVQLCGGLYGGVVGYLSQEGIAPVVVVHLAAVVRETVAHDEVVYVQQHVVDGDLVKHTLRYLDARSLVLHYHLGLQTLVIEHRVGTQLLIAACESYLIGEQCRWIALVLREEVYEVLSDPLLGGQRHIAPSQYVEYFGTLLRPRQFYFKTWKI